MRTFARLTMLCVSLTVLACAARAQPPEPPPTPRDEPCRTAARKYAWHFSDDSRRRHMSVGESYRIALDAGVKYLRLCGKRRDAFTSHVRAAVSAAEAARRCEAETWPRYSERVEVADSATRGQKRRAYEAAKKFLRLCQRYGTPSTSRAMRRVNEYEAAARVEEAEKTLASLVPAARAARAGATAPETYARIAEAYSVARFQPAHQRFLWLGGADRITVGEPKEMVAQAREAQTRMNAALDRVIDAYARAVASCGGREACRASKAAWERQLETFYAYRHGGDDAGLEETIARAFDAPMPNP